MMKNRFYLDKQKFFVLISVLFLLSSFIWVEATAQESIIDSNVVEEDLDLDISQEVSGEIVAESIELDDSSIALETENIENLSDFELNSSLNEQIPDNSEFYTDLGSEDLVPYVVFNNDGKKEIETVVEEDSDISIIKEESVTLSSEESWEKEVTVSSDEHFERSLIVYSDIKEGEIAEIELYWLNDRIDVTNDPAFEFTLYDTDNDGLDDRVSFVVPHLSEQNFEIRITYNSNQSSSSSLNIDVLNSPNQIISSSRLLPFNFSIDYYNISSVFCDLKILIGSNTIYNQNGFISSSFAVNTSSLGNGNYTWNLLCKDYYFPETNDTESGNFQIAVNYTPYISFTSSSTVINSSQSVNFYVNLTTIDNRQLYYTLFYGEGTLIGPNSTNNILRSFSHTYNSVNNYVASLTVIDGSTTYSFTIPISVLNSTSSPTNSQSNAGNIEVTLNSPSNNAVLNTNSVNFSYSVKSNVSISNCSFNLYYFNNTGLGVLVYNEINYSIRNNVTDLISLQSFDEGDYSWEVECVDSERKYDSSDRDFSFESYTNITQLSLGSSSNSSYERKEEIESILENIDSFLDNLDSYSFEEKELIDILGISDDLVSYKRKLNQFKQDLKHNINFIRTEEEREKRKTEIFKEIDEIKSKVPIDIEVVKSEEYVKNSVDGNIEDIVSNYVESENLVLSSREVRKLAAYTKEIQNSLKVSVKAIQAVIDYEDGQKESTFLIKTITLDSNRDYKILESISKSIDFDADLTILNKYEIVTNKSLFSVGLSDLIDEKLIYYFEGLVSLENLKESDTILFTEDFEDNGGFITGFSILGDSDGLSSFAIYLSWALLIFIFLIGGFVFVKRTVLNRYASDDVIAIRAIISDTKRSLTNKDITRAKVDYDKIREIYSYLPNQSKAVVYKDVQNILFKINGIEVSDLIQECIDSIRNGRKEDALLIYESIKQFYNIMPKKYKQKIHSRLMPYMYFFNR